MIKRFLFFLGIVFIVTLAPIWVFTIFICVYAFLYTPYELLFLAICIDGFYGVGNPFLIPYYTILSCSVVIFAEWIKPRISGYNQ